MTSYAAALQAHGTTVAAAAYLGIPRTTFQSRLKAEQAGRKSKLAAMDIKPLAKPRTKHAWSSNGNRVLHDDGSRLIELETLPESVLCFSCTQAPFQHPDALGFLAMVLASYKPRMTVCHGDEVDLKFFKQAFMRPDGLGPAAELSGALEFMRGLFRIIPEAICLSSNHVAGRIDHGQAHGNFPTRMLRPWAEVCDAPPTWIWRDYLIMRNWLFEHGHGVSKGARGSLVEDMTKRFGRPLSVMRGHFHSEFGEHIKPIWTQGGRQIRACYTGCLMDPREVNYTRAPTMLGCVVLIRGVPHPVPMVLDAHNRWIGKLMEW